MDDPERPTTEPMLGERFSDALVWAAEVHRGQSRKGGAIPYISHLLAVTSLVLEDGGSEDEAIAALLHDVVEDHPNVAPLTEVERRFGPRVAEIVHALSDADEHPKPPWRERKERYLAHLEETTDEGVLRVSLADKLHNVRSIARDGEVVGDRVWQRFSRPREEQLWYYRRLVEILGPKAPGPMASELEQRVAQLERLE